MLVLLNNDIALFYKMRKGDNQSFRKIYDKYWEQLYRIAISKIKSKEDAEDLIHDLFLDLWNNREKIEIKTNFAAYLFTALKYKIFRYIDHKTVIKKHVELSTPDREFIFNQNIEEEIWSRELYGKYEEKMNSLPEKCRAVYKMSRIHMYKVQEIAEEMNISPNTAQNHINKALRILKLELNKILLILFVLFN